MRMRSTLRPTIRCLWHSPANGECHSYLTAPETISRWLLFKKRKNRFLRALMGNVRTPSMARWKARGRLYIRHNWTFFRYLLRLRRYKRKSVEVGVSRRWVSHFERRFHCWCQSSRVIALSCGIKISAVHHLILSQSTRVTDRRTDRQNHDSQDRPRACSRGKKQLLHDSGTNFAPESARHRSQLAHWLWLSAPS